MCTIFGGFIEKFCPKLMINFVFKVRFTMLWDLSSEKNIPRLDAGSLWKGSIFSKIVFYWKNSFRYLKLITHF